HGELTSYLSPALPLTQYYSLSLHDALPIFGHRRQQWDQDEGDLEEVDEEAEEEDHRVHEHQEADLAARQLVEQVLDPDLAVDRRSEEHTSELQSRENLVCRLLLEKKK